MWKMFSRSPFFQKTIEITLGNFFPNFSPVSAFSFSSAKWNWTAAAAAAASRMETGGYLMELLFLDINSIAAVACFSCLHSSSIPSLLAPVRSEILLNRKSRMEIWSVPTLLCFHCFHQWNDIHSIIVDVSDLWLDCAALEAGWKLEAVWLKQTMPSFDY